MLPIDSVVDFPPNGGGLLPLPLDAKSELPILVVLNGSAFALAGLVGGTGGISFFGTAVLVEVSGKFCENGFGATADIGG